jgi:glycerol dehydrogenase
MNLIGYPRRYIQGNGTLDCIGEILRDFNKKPFFVVDRAIKNNALERVKQSLAKEGLQGKFTEFVGECSRSEITRQIRICTQEGCEVIVGMGGGKTADTVKAIALELSFPVVIVPTIASNDAPTSRVIVIYSDAGVLTEVLTLPFNPDIVVVDTGIIATAPKRYLAAGIGDALATKFEAEQCYASGAMNFFKARPCYAALVMADSSYQLIREFGVSALRSAGTGVVTEALERVIEANILLSGLGFESGGVAAAHAINQGFTLIEELHSSLHGENVAFGLLAQFVLENRSERFLRDMILFYGSLGLPRTLSQLGLKDVTEENLYVIARHACRENSYIYNMTVEIDVDKVIKAIRTADALGRELS